MPLQAKVVTWMRWVGVIAFCIAYPVLSQVAAHLPSPNLLGASVALSPFVVLGLLMTWRSTYRLPLIVFCLICFIGIAWQKDWVLTHYNYIYLLEHAGTQGLLSLTFLMSLQPNQVPMITRFASFVHPHMSALHQRYTRQVTMAWALLFGMITALSLSFFVFAPFTTWASFANIGTPCLMIAMFAIEYAVRCLVVPLAERGSWVDTVHAIKASMATTSTESHPQAEVVQGK